MDQPPGVRLAQAAVGGAGDGGDDLHQGGLAGAVGAEQADHPGAELEGEVIDGGDAPAEALGDVVEREHRRLRKGSGGWNMAVQPPEP